MELVPPGPILVLQEDRGSIGPHPGGLDLHEGDQPVDLGLPGREPGKDPAEAKGVPAQLRPDPILAGRGDALGQRGDGHQEGPGDLLGGQTAQQAQGQGDPGLA